MPRKVLDTSVLVTHWHKRRAGRPLDQLGVADANAWGQELIQIQDGSVIVTPVNIEFLGGARSAAELKTLCGIPEVI